MWNVECQNLSTWHSRPEAFFLQALVEMCDEVAVAVEDQSWPALAGADEFLLRLTPTRVRNLGIHVRPETVLARTDCLPQADWPRVGEGEAHNRFDGFESVLPRN